MVRFGDVSGFLMCGPEGTQIYKQYLVNINNRIFKQESGWAVNVCCLRLRHRLRVRKALLIQTFTA